MKKICRIIFAVGLFLALATSANALTAGYIPDDGSTNDFTSKFGVNAFGGYFGAQIYLVGATADLQFDYYGAEAGYHNEFNFGGVELFDHPGGNTASATPLNITPVVVENVSPGLLNFSFDYNNNAGSVVNGSNPDNQIFNLPNFFVTFDITRQTAGGPTGGQSVWLFLDDGATSDDNHDDMLVKISITNGQFSIPEPTTLLLLGLGLIGLAGMRRKA